MVFSSSLFLVYFFPVFLLVYYLVKKEYKNMTALAASVLFYAWGGKFFTAILFVTLIADFKLVERMAASKGEERKFMFWAALLLNVALLGYFKYANFFIENVDAILGSQSTWVKVMLPIGISFCTFHKMSYIIDVYRGTYKPLKSFVDYALYILLFPQLIAGPIVRYGEISKDLVDREQNETIDNKILGLFRFAVGLAKKVLIANVLGETATQLFALDSNTLSISQAWLGAAFYTLHIYFDFAGYSDMAIGIGRMLGFNFPENFNFPYIAQSITEFWQRWHITLGRWMKDYLYIPLGGNRVSANRMYINLCLVFLLSGLWHGANWNFIIWGIFHGGFLILDRLFLLDFHKKIGKFPSIALTLAITMVGWVIFASKDLNQVQSYLSAMLGQGLGTAVYIIDFQAWVLFVTACLFAFSPLVGKLKPQIIAIETLATLSQKQASILTASTFVLISLSLCYVASSGFNPFIYFRF